jgi:hypothetical protein
MAQEQQGNNALAQRVQEATELLAEINSVRQASAKELVTWRQQKDGIVGTGQHHTGRSAAKNQIAKDLVDFISKFGQQ